MDSGAGSYRQGDAIFTAGRRVSQSVRTLSHSWIIFRKTRRTGGFGPAPSRPFLRGWSQDRRALVLGRSLRDLRDVLGFDTAMVNPSRILTCSITLMSDLPSPVSMAGPICNCACNWSSAATLP